MNMIELAKTLTKLTPEQMMTVATHMVYFNESQAEHMQTHLYVQLLDASEFLEETV